MKKYYFICSLFPKLSLGNKPEIAFDELKKILDWNLDEKDKEFVKILKMYVDLKNLKALWEKKPLDNHGNLDEKGLDEALLTESFFPSIVFDYIRKYEDKIKNFSILLSSFLKYNIKNKNKFLTYFYKLEREMKILSCALKAKEEGKNIEKELIFEDVKDHFVAMIISQKGNDLEISEYEKLKEIFIKNKDNPKKLHFSYLELRFHLNNKKIEGEYFTIDQILGYIANLFIVEDYYRLDKDHGKILLDTYVG